MRRTKPEEEGQPEDQIIVVEIVALVHELDQEKGDTKDKAADSKKETGAHRERRSDQDREVDPEAEGPPDRDPFEAAVFEKEARADEELIEPPEGPEADRSSCHQEPEEDPKEDEGVICEWSAEPTPEGSDHQLVVVSRTLLRDAQVEHRDELALEER